MTRGDPRGSIGESIELWGRGDDHAKMTIEAATESGRNRRGIGLDLFVEVLDGFIRWRAAVNLREHFVPKMRD
jgi:hypothetical protein